MLMDVRGRPEAWIFDASDVAYNAGLNAIVIEALKLEECPPLPVTTLEWRWPHDDFRAQRDTYGPHYFPDAPDETALQYHKHDLLIAHATKTLEFASSFIASAGRLLPPEVGAPLDTEHEVYASVERYQHCLDWLARQRLDYYAYADRRRQFNSLLLESMLSTDTEDAVDWVSSGRPLYALRLTDAERLRSLFVP